MEEVITAADASSSLRSYSSQSSVCRRIFLFFLPSCLCLSLSFLKCSLIGLKKENGTPEGCLAQVACRHHMLQQLHLLLHASGYKEGTSSSSFAIAVVLSCVVMYDATGVRLHAGRQAELLNQIVCELPPEHPLSQC